MYLSGIDSFYHNVDKYFLEKIRRLLSINQDLIFNMEEALEEIISLVIDEFVKLGLYRAKVQNRFFDKFIKLKIEENNGISSIYDLYKKKIAPLIYELIFEQVIFYLVDDRGVPIILGFKNSGLLTIEFIIELRNLKVSLDETPEKLEKLRKYIRIRDKIILKFCKNKEKIEALEELDDIYSKVQLLYLIYKIIDFFNIQYFFNFSQMKKYLNDHLEDYIENIPQISLKNPDLCYCVLYLVYKLNISFNHERIKNFLLNLYKKFLDDFEVPILEATNQIYFYFQSTSLANVWLTHEQIKRIVKFKSEAFDMYYLKNMETSQLAYILAMFAFLESFNNSDYKKIEKINDEIEMRVNTNGIMENRDNFYSSEASYYTIFSNYVNNNLRNQKLLFSENLIDNLVFKIYRNLELIDFAGEMNTDLLSELFYSVESLRLLNCINLREIISFFASYFFPKQVEHKIIENKKIPGTKMKVRFLTINKINGESNYIITS